MGSTKGQRDSRGGETDLAAMEREPLPTGGLPLGRPARTLYMFIEHQAASPGLVMGSGLQEEPGRCRVDKEGPMEQTTVWIGRLRHVGVK